MKVTVSRVGPVAFEARNAEGATLRMDGPPDLGGMGTGLRPMEAVLAALAGCSGIDVVKILRQQREPLTSLDIEVEATRADTIPAVFTAIHVTFRIGGPVARGKAERAVALSMEKYCSVSKMLEPAVRVTWSAHVSDVP